MKNAYRVVSDLCLKGREYLEDEDIDGIDLYQKREE
jgi:hypothetical protein